MSDAAEVLDYWVNAVGQKGWYVANPEVDETIRRRFGALPDEAETGALDVWAETPSGALALLIVLDQFPRNLYRDDAQAFGYDKKARAVAADALDRGHDLATPAPERQFFYLPFMHSEELADQEMCVRLFEERMPEAAENLKHAVAHRDVIQRFNRFPHRNGALGRESTPEEVEYLENGGYAPGARPAAKTDAQTAAKDPNA